MVCSKSSSFGFLGGFNYRAIGSGVSVSSSSKRRHQAIFFAAYILFGILHELFHVVVAKIVVVLRSSSSTKIVEDKSLLSLSSSIGKFLSRATFGRYTLITIPPATKVDEVMSSETAASIITHSGWILSLLLALGMHYLYSIRLRGKNAAAAASKNATKHASSSISVSAVSVAPTFILAAYIAAVESITSDLMGFVPKMVKNFVASSASSSSTSSFELLLHCGNFGVILLNSQWINIDGGQRALSVLEKMVEVTMMRGAQSGGVVTFEPTSSGRGGGKDANPVIRGVRSRVVNAKRTVLSEGVRKKIEKDNCGLMGGGKLKGWNDVEFNATQSESSSSVAAKRLVRGFFGHTRFATSSKASMDGTHPHKWTPRQTLTCYGFQSKEGSLQGQGDGGTVDGAGHVMRVAPKGQLMEVENFITHNGKCKLDVFVSETVIDIFGAYDILDYIRTIYVFRSWHSY